MENGEGKRSVSLRRLGHAEGALNFLKAPIVECGDEQDLAEIVIFPSIGEGDFLGREDEDQSTELSLGHGLFLCWSLDRRVLCSRELNEYDVGFGFGRDEFLSFEAEMEEVIGVE
jgi:hypothetical protein